MRKVLRWIRWTFAGTSLGAAIIAHAISSLFKLVAELSWPPEEPPKDPPT